MKPNEQTAAYPHPLQSSTNKTATQPSLSDDITIVDEQSPSFLERQRDSPASKETGSFISHQI